MDRAALERKHVDLGLRFSPGGLGGVPAQAYGWIGEDRFYFRFRHDCAQLSVGPVDAELDMAIALRTTQQNVGHRERDQIQLSTLPEDDIDDRLWLMMSSSRPVGERPQAADDLQYYPNRITRYASRQDVTGEQYAGFLEEDEFCDLFEQLMLGLAPVTADEQIPKFTTGWLAAGGLWPAAA
ncbi:hypothetical protein [Leifsonia sp. Leaf264]|uniref:hypothetical protein n=1 Tax=Leifsonia sp. Leaf264 TaxID=1736314 RepID=UPI0006F5B445|nr:hypothetical protein [Leifsonia sp. Leaf264]KQO98131.1 hypothetical protein ASF30_08600 [Leifsonia sp. Leaf264]